MIQKCLDAQQRASAVHFKYVLRHYGPKWKALQGVASVEKAVEMFCPFFILYVHVLTCASSRREKLLALSTNTWETVLTVVAKPLLFFIGKQDARFAVCLLLLFFFCPLKWQVLFQSKLSLRENERNSCQPHSHYG